jgi:hypothetical protein
MVKREYVESDQLLTRKGKESRREKGSLYSDKAEHFS